ncbi:class I SAM-dependent methyltransferase [Sedimenticola selenatireducens]|uniref:SAM-dependent methyltransferase n=1 Tax=Sedimenticola selenatireducens TaxID=191960 RepID=A0A2N6D0E1_9GAMM|nr:class I SAM-dependent methyltransferase [Sedimenticola selenatireducens]PLX63126.1 MAG: SAM-dependent methyltransferase [Sedimenticola selenatireducens]
MNNRFKDHFSKDSTAYSQYRPGYPPDLFEYLASLTKTRHIAWDCATGSGQAAYQLAGYYDRVIATDASSSQIAATTSHDNIDYRVATAEQSGIDDASVDLVTVAQALHWFDLKAFFDEVRRVVKPGGVIAVWSYNLLKIAPGIDPVIDRLYHDTLQGYWPEERERVERGYGDIPFPFTPVSTMPVFSMTADWSLPHLLGYLGTWSAVQRMIQETGHNPVEQIGQALTRIWGDPDKPRPVAWPLSIRVGYNP